MNFVNTIVQGILLGGLYALYAAGLSLIFGVMRLVNLAHGDFIVLAAYAILALSSAFLIPPIFAVLIAAPFLFALGWALQRVILNRTVSQNFLVPLLVTFGLQIIIQNGLLLGFSADSQRLSIGAIGTESITVLGISIGLLPLLTFIAAIVLIGALSILFYSTALGRKLRATSDSAHFSQIVGINPRAIFAIAMGISFIVIAVAAFFMAARSNFDPSMGPARLLYAFEAVVIGGLGSLWGTLAGGIILGVAQGIGAVINPQYQILAGHLVFLLIILVRPRGLFPKQ